MINELFKLVPGFPNYLVSSAGYVIAKNYRNLGKQQMLKGRVGRKGYAKVTLCLDGVHKDFCIHRLVAQLFIPNPRNLPQVNHKDGDKLNNNLSNLEWCTARDNTKHAVDVIQTISKTRLAVIGRLAAKSHRLLTKEDVHKALYLRTVQRMTYKEIGIAVGCSLPTVWRVVNGKSYKDIILPTSCTNVQEG